MKSFNLKKAFCDSYLGIVIPVLIEVGLLIGLFYVFIHYPVVVIVIAGSFLLGNFIYVGVKKDEI